MENILKGQFDENKMRKDFTPSEAVALWMAMENRQGERTDQGEEPRSNLDQSSGQRKERAAEATGRSAATLSKAKQVVAAAEENPEKYGDLKEQMDREDNVDGPYQELRRRGISPGGYQGSNAQQLPGEGDCGIGLGSGEDCCLPGAWFRAKALVRRRGAVSVRPAGGQAGGTV